YINVTPHRPTLKNHPSQLLAIEDQAAARPSPVRTVAEIVQHLLRPASAQYGRQLEHRPVVVSATLGSRAVEIASTIEDHGVRISSVRAVVVEAMQHLLLGGRPSAGHKQGRSKDCQCRLQSDGKSLASHG